MVGGAQDALSRNSGVFIPDLECHVSSKSRQTLKHGTWDNDPVRKFGVSKMEAWNPGHRSCHEIRALARPSGFSSL